MDKTCPADDGGTTEGGISRPQLIAVLYLVGVLNGFAAAIVQSIHAEGLWQALGLTFGMSIVDVAATAVGVNLARQSPPAPLARSDYFAAAVAALLILVPHRAMSWAAITGLAVYEMARNRRSAPAMAAASVFILLAASVLWGRVLAQVLAGTLLSWDAWLAAGLLDLLTGGGVERIENVIIAGQRSLVVLPSCSSLRNVLYGLLCWLTIARALRREWQRGDLFAAVIVSGTVVAANTLRISLLGLSEESYERVHGTLGEKSSTSAFSSLPRPLRWVLLAIRPRLWLASAAVMLAAASLSGKIGFYSRTATGEAEVSEEQRATDLFIRYGWTAIGTIEPERHTTLRFIGPMCPAGIQVTVVPPGGEISGVLARAGGEDNRVFYVHGGKISDEPPRFIYIEDRIRELLRALGIAWPRSSAVFAIVGPVQCQLRRTLPWFEL